MHYFFIFLYLAYFLRLWVLISLGRWKLNLSYHRLFPESTAKFQGTKALSVSIGMCFGGIHLTVNVPFPTVSIYWNEMDTYPFGPDDLSL